MRIIHMSSAHNLNDPRFVMKMCPSLVQSGHDVHLIICGFENEIPHYLSVTNVKIHLIKPTKKRLLRIFFKSNEVLNLGAKLSGDIYHFHDPELLLYALIYKNKLSRPFVYDIHENYPDDILTKEWIPKLLRFLISKIFKFFENFVAFRLNGLVAATDTIAKRFNNHPNCIIVHNYPLLDEFSKSKFKFNNINNSLVYVGNISKLRGLDTMLDSMSLVGPSVKLELAGQLIDNYSDSQLKNNLLSSQIVYHGLLNREEIDNLFAQSSAGLLLFKPINSFITALPNKLFEYMAAGLPVIASNFPLWRSIILKVQCGILVNPNDPSSLAKGITYLIENKNQAITMGNNGRKAIEKFYNWPNEFKRLLFLYNKLL
jgi:glycosyltransferase involved in cell wall biosynthesis